MSKRMNLIFEPADLEQASPATVSRCGMIFLEPKLLGWRPLMDSYKKILEKYVLVEQLEIIIDLVDWLVPPCLKFLKTAPVFLKTSDIHLFYVF